MQCKFLIVGAGIIGLTIARELLQRGHTDLIILEKEPGPGFHASGRNSGVLHAGIYYSVDSFKARFCIEGNRLMKEFCRKKNLPLIESGKVIVAPTESHLSGLHELKKRADSNGAGAHLIGRRELEKLEPFAFTCQEALHSPNTAVVDPHKILYALQQEIIESKKAQIFYDQPFESVDIKFEKLINAAGTHADKIVHSFGLGSEYKILPFKGTYHEVISTDLVNGNIYSVPDLRNPFLGIHFCKNVHGQITLGPTAIPALSRENYGMFENLESETLSILYREAVLLIRNDGFRDAAITQIKKYSPRVIYEEARAMVPELQYEDLRPSSKVGIRAQLVNWKKHELVMDFVILQDERSLHILNAVSPAFTSSMAFARYVADLI